MADLFLEYNLRPLTILELLEVEMETGALVCGYPCGWYSAAFAFALIFVEGSSLNSTRRGMWSEGMCCVGKPTNCFV